MENISQIGIKHNNANLQQTVIDNAASTSQCLCRLTELCRAIKLDDIETYEMFSSMEAQLQKLWELFIDNANKHQDYLTNFTPSEEAPSARELSFLECSQIQLATQNYIKKQIEVRGIQKWPMSYTDMLLLHCLYKYNYQRLKHTL